MKSFDLMIQNLIFYKNKIKKEKKKLRIFFSLLIKKIFNQRLFKSAIKKDKRYFDGNNHFILMDKKFKISSKLTPIKYDEFYNILKKYIC